MLFPVVIFFGVLAFSVSSVPVLSQEECNSIGIEALELLGEFVQKCSPNAAQKLPYSMCKTIQLKLSSLIANLEGRCRPQKAATQCPPYHPCAAQCPCPAPPPPAPAINFEGDTLINPPGSN